MGNVEHTSWRKSSYSANSGNCVEIAVGWRKSSYSDANGECVEVATGWRRSSHSGGNGECVEVATGWCKSSHSGGNGGCVEVADTDRCIAVRDTKQHGHGTVLEFAMDAWRAFLAEAKSSKLDPSIG